MEQHDFIRRVQMVCGAVAFLGGASLALCGLYVLVGLPIAFIVGGVILMVVGFNIVRY